MFLLIDPRYFIFALPGLALALLASWKVKSTYAKYSRVPTRGGVSGAWAARAILTSHGLEDVPVEQIPGRGQLSDYYDPRSRVLRLSQGVYGGNSVAAVGVAAHEAGHAVQHATGYWALAMRQRIVPIARFGPGFAMTMFVIGMFMARGAPGPAGALQMAGILLYAAVAVFALVTLPVELNASRRALALLSASGVLTQEELPGARRVLTAAALTYVAAAAQALLILLYMITSRRR